MHRIMVTGRAKQMKKTCSTGVCACTAWQWNCVHVGGEVGSVVIERRWCFGHCTENSIAHNACWLCHVRLQPRLAGKPWFAMICLRTRHRVHACRRPSHECQPAGPARGARWPWQDSVCDNFYVNPCFVHCIDDNAACCAPSCTRTVSPQTTNRQPSS